MNWFLSRLICYLHLLTLTAVTYGQNTVTTEEICNGKACILGKSGSPIGTILKGRIISRVHSKDLNSVKYTVSTLSPSGQELHLSFENDLLFERCFIQRMPQKFSEMELVGREVLFFEDVTCGGDPIGFNLPPDLLSGPHFKLRFRMNLVPDIGIQTLLDSSKEVMKKVSWSEIDSGTVPVFGLLGVTLGTVKSAKVRIELRGTQSFAILNSDQKELSIGEDGFMFNVLGRYFPPSQVEINGTVEASVYERLVCSGLPIEMKELDDSEKFEQFTIRSFFVIKVDESSLSSPLFD